MSEHTDEQVHKVVHKANYRITIKYYIGFGNYGSVTTPECMTKLKKYCPSAVVGYKMHRNWSKVTCKKCLQRVER